MRALRLFLLVSSLTLGACGGGVGGDGTPDAAAEVCVADDPGDTGSESNAECHEDNNLSFIEVAGCVGID